jgi:glycerate kinase
MKIVIAADSFKDALPAPQVCAAIADGVRKAMPEAEIVIFPLTDGGDGLAEVFSHHLGGDAVQMQAYDPLGREIQCTYILSANGENAFIEMAQASGLQRLSQEERNPMLTSSYGTGQMIAHALDSGVQHILLGLGGSATNDAGIGMAAALGFEFYTAQGKELLPRGESLLAIERIGIDHVHPGLAKTRFEALCDVKNPLFGHSGAAYVFGPQKGASAAMVERLDEGLQHFASLLQQTFGQDFASAPGAGAAGGLGAGCLAFLKAQLFPGIEAVMNLTNFDAALEGADLIITGEGRLDGQTLGGKLIRGICTRATQQGIPTIALCGTIDADQPFIDLIGLKAAFAIGRKLQIFDDALASTEENLRFTAEQVMKVVSL